jgi:hypothetical protein
MKFPLLIVLLLILSGNQQLCAQGCSDAGICTAGPLSSGGHINLESLPDSAASYSKGSVGLFIGLAQGEQGTFIFAPKLEASFHPQKNSTITFSWQFLQYTTGNLGSHAGTGDIVIQYSQQAVSKKWFTLQAFGGFKFPTGNSNAKNISGLSLPMPYQSSLGSFDILLGMQARIAKYINVSLGYQQPFAHINKNGFTPAIYTGSGKDLEASSYFVAPQLRRMGDLAFRLEGVYDHRKFSVSAGILGIYHLGKDSYGGDLNLLIPGSKQLTLNISGQVVYFINNHFTIQTAFGIPLIVRDERPDGLTRKWVIAPAFFYNF